MGQGPSEKVRVGQGSYRYGRSGYGRSKKSSKQKKVVTTRVRSVILTFRFYRTFIRGLIDAVNNYWNNMMANYKILSLTTDENDCQWAA